MIRPIVAALLIAASGATAPIRAEAENLAMGTVPDAPEDGGFRYLEVAVAQGALNLRSGASTTSAVVAQLATGTVLNHFGCSSQGARGWCDVQPVAGGPRGFVAAEFLRPAIGLNGTPLVGDNDSALRAGQGDFDARGQIPCATRAGQPMGSCDFGVARAGGGDATVVITKPDGMTRAIFFTLGDPISADTSQADYGEFSAKRAGDLSLVAVGTERYEIPDAVVLGG